MTTVFIFSDKYIHLDVRHEILDVRPSYNKMDLFQYRSGLFPSFLSLKNE